MWDSGLIRPKKQSKAIRDQRTKDRHRSYDELGQVDQNLTGNWGSARYLLLDSNDFYRIQGLPVPR